MPKKNRNWTGYIVVIPDQHTIIITGLWKKDSPDKWWWKCRDCTRSSGILTSRNLEKLEKKGMIAEPDGEKLPSEYSLHPTETNYIYDDEYGYGYM